MAFSASDLFSAFGGVGGDGSRYGVKRGKKETPDGSTIQLVLEGVPASLDVEDFEEAARVHGLSARGVKPETGQFFQEKWTGIRGERSIRAVMDFGRDGDEFDPEAEREALSSKPKKSNKNKGRGGDLNQEETEALGANGQG